MKYIGREHADHLLQVVTTNYKCAIDWEGRRYLGMVINWDYMQKKAHVSMLEYVPEALVQFRHKAPQTPQHQPYLHVKPTYGATRQYAEAHDTSDPLSKEETTYIQENIPLLRKMCGRLDATSTGNACHTTGKPNKKYNEKIKQFLDFAATYPDAVVTYHASNMVLAGHSNASYLSKSNARSRAGGHLFMSKNMETPPNNGAVFTILQIIKAVMSSAAEAKIGALYINCHKVVPARHVLEFMGHKQPATPMQTDNTTALGVINKNVMKKIKVDGHEIPLAKVLHQSDAIQTLLGSLVNKLG